jgi:hypothetical protein
MQSNAPKFTYIHSNRLFIYSHLPHTYLGTWIYPRALTRGTSKTFFATRPDSGTSHILCTSRGFSTNNHHENLHARTLPVDTCTRACRMRRVQRHTPLEGAKCTPPVSTLCGYHNLLGVFGPFYKPNDPHRRAGAVVRNQVRSARSL